MARMQSVSLASRLESTAAKIRPALRPW